jgi:hypothetical protein
MCPAIGDRLNIDPVSLIECLLDVLGESTDKIGLNAHLAKYFPSVGVYPVGQSENMLEDFQPQLIWKIWHCNAELFGNLDR